jgi:four helix bundle protein
VIVFAFEKLVAYQKAKEFRARMYKLSKLLPADEYKLRIQIRDASRSLTNNLAEGHGRYTFKERIRFCHDSRGSLQELVDDVSIFEQERYAKQEHLDTLRVDANQVLKLINGYISYLEDCGAKELAKRNAAKKSKFRPDQLGDIPN